MGTESTCVANVECELLWVYRGDPGACENVIVQVIEVVGEDETVLAEDTTANDGRDLKVVPGDAEANEFTIRLKQLEAEKGEAAFNEWLRASAEKARAAKAASKPAKRVRR